MAVASSSATSAEPSPAPSSSIDSVNPTVPAAGTGAEGAVASPETAPDDSSKLRTFLGILRKYV